MVWNDCPIRTEKGPGCPSLKLLLGSACFVGSESQMIKASKTNLKPTKVKMLPVSELHFIMKKKNFRCC